MTQPVQSGATDTTQTQQTATIGGMPVAQLRALLNEANDELLAAFIHSFSIGYAADIFIAHMVQPDERANFIIGIATAYPDDWAKAIAKLSAK